MCLYLKFIMTIEILIDNRETKLKQHFLNLPYIKIQNLELGDIIIKYENEIILIIERKRLDDLASSIKSGRYKQQKIRLLSTYPKHKILYLIEGNLNQSPNEIISGLNYYTLTSSLINCLVRDNLKIYKTIDINETIQFIENFITKLQKQGICFMKTKSTEETIDEFNNSLIKRNKKKNLTPKLCFLGQLCQIPGISIIKAKPIVAKYNTISNLVMAYEMSGLSDDEKKTFLSEIVYTNKNKNRKIGKKASNVIYEYLF